MAKSARLSVRYAPGPACRQLVALAEQRGTDDNVSAQVIQIEEIEAVGYYRGAPMFHKPAEKAVTGEVEAGSTTRRPVFHA